MNKPIRQFNSDVEDMLHMTQIYVDLTKCKGARLVRKKYICAHCFSLDPKNECLAPKPRKATIKEQYQRQVAELEEQNSKLVEALDDIANSNQVKISDSHNKVINCLLECKRIAREALAAYRRD